MNDKLTTEFSKYLRYLPLEDRACIKTDTYRAPWLENDDFSEMIASMSESIPETYMRLKSVASIIGLDKLIDDIDSCECYDMKTGATFIKKIISATPTLLSGKYDLNPSMSSARKGVIDELLLHYIPFRLNGISAYHQLHKHDYPSLEIDNMSKIMQRAYRVLQLKARDVHASDEIPDFIMDAINIIVDYVRALYDLFNIKEHDPLENVENLYMYHIYLLTSSVPIYVKAKEIYKNRIVEPVNLTDIFQHQSENDSPLLYYQMESRKPQPLSDKVQEFSDMIIDNTAKQFNFFGDNVFVSHDMDEIEKELRYLSKEKIAQIANIGEEDSIQFKVDEQIGMYLKEELSCPMCEIQMIRDGRVDFITCISYEGDTFIIFTKTKKPDTIYGLSLLSGKDVKERKLLSFDNNEDTEFRLVVDDNLK